MAGTLFDGARKPEHLGVREERNREHPRDLGPADCERPGLIEDGDGDAPELLERGAMAENEASPRRAIDAPDDSLHPIRASISRSFLPNVTRL
jgi:hypothetical protein